jgi:hypothetical protein
MLRLMVTSLRGCLYFRPRFVTTVKVAEARSENREDILVYY